MRMIQSLTQFRLIDALHYNALAVVFVGILMWSWLAWLGRTLGLRLTDPLRWPKAPVAIGILVGMWFVLRILPYEPFTQLQV